MRISGGRRRKGDVWVAGSGDFGLDSSIVFDLELSVGAMNASEFDEGMVFVFLQIYHESCIFAGIVIIMK